MQDRHSRTSSLNRNVSFAVGAAILVTAVLLASASFVTSYRLQMATHRHDSLLKTVLVSTSLGGAVRFGKIETLDEILAEFAAAQPDVFGAAAIYSAEGAVMTGTDTEFDAAALVARAGEAEEAFAEGTLTVAPIPFGADGETAGYLVVRWSDTPILQALKRQAMTLGGAGLVLAVLAWVAAFWLISKLVGAPVMRLTGKVGQVAEGELDIEVPMIGRRDEIGTLARRFEELRAQLKISAEERARQADRDAEAEAAKEKMLGDLENGVGEVVEAARRGVFDRNVERRFDDPVMQRLADDVNALCATMAEYLGELGQTAEAMAAGRFDRVIPDRFGGRLGDVARQLNATMGQVDTLVDRISGTEATMSEAIGTMRTDAAELSRRSENQAGSLQQAAAAMEELTASTQLTTDNVTASAGMAETSKDCAEKGSAILRDAITAVDEIKIESDRISDIISVIEGIAFQTNLLALNAAVEAARAGDAGKGFAVVASEVRSLAQRAADATSDITQLIVNSQDKVSKGAELVNRSGEVLETISKSITDVSDRLADIANSTQEQNLGIRAMSNELLQLDEATQVSNQIAKRSSSAAATLEQQATTLAELLAGLRSDGTAAVGNAGAPRKVA